MSSSARVLVVEDDQAIRESLMDILEDHGYAPLGAANGRDALDKLTTADHRPCLIVLDLMMPVMDGRSFREHQLLDPELSTIPVLVISAYRDLVEKASDMKAIALLQKPLKVNEFLRLVNEHCCHCAGSAG